MRMDPLPTEHVWIENIDDFVQIISLAEIHSCDALPGVM